MIAIALTLGHNSSACIINDGQVVHGYEEERISGVKSDSYFPKLTMYALSRLCDMSQVDFICVSHWDTYGEVSNMSSKHWDPLFVRQMCPNASILSHSSDFSHHDAHMELARLYSGLDGYTIVADGFGNFNEVISVYHGNDLIHRVHGYDKSLGLLYQYATDFLGMKMNQDEYKLLGYEAHVDEIRSLGANEVLDNAIIRFKSAYTISSLSKNIKPKFDALCNIHALPELRESLHKKFNTVIKDMEKHEEMTEFKTRVAIARLVQSTVEDSIVALVNKYGMDKVTLSGGLFYNVKLNNRVLKNVDKISVVPLAGDQGCGLGVYQRNFKNLVFPGTLCIGKRQFASGFINHEKARYRALSPETLQEIAECIDYDMIVNVVHGNMEFGPRALGNTSTLMLPFERNVHYVNHLNGRSTIMPMAPIVTSLEFFEDEDKVVRSYEHMIITLDYKKEHVSSGLLGAAHKYPYKDKYSGRPQFIDDDHWLFPIVDKFKILINTSYNMHGSPIIYNDSQLSETFYYQAERDNEDRMVTFIIE